MVLHLNPPAVVEPAGFGVSGWVSTIHLVFNVSFLYGPRQQIGWLPPQSQCEEPDRGSTRDWNSSSGDTFGSGGNRAYIRRDKSPV